MTYTTGSLHYTNVGAVKYALVNQFIFGFPTYIVRTPKRRAIRVVCALRQADVRCIEVSPTVLGMAARFAAGKGWKTITVIPAEFVRNLLHFNTKNLAADGQFLLSNPDMLDLNTAFGTNLRGYCYGRTGRMFRPVNFPKPEGDMNFLDV